MPDLYFENSFEINNFFFSKNQKHFTSNLEILQLMDMFKFINCKKNLLEVGNKNDLIIYSDADEIINPKLIEKLPGIKNNVVICSQYCFYYKLNLLSDYYKKGELNYSILNQSFIKRFL